MGKIYILIETASGRVRVFDDWPFDSNTKYDFENETPNRWRIDLNGKRGIATLLHKQVLHKKQEPSID